MTWVPRPTPKVDSPSAPTLASLSRWTGSPRRSSISAAGSSPTQPGRIGCECTRPLSRSIGPGRPMPAASTRPRSTPASSISSDDQRGGGVEGVLGGGVDLELREGLGQDRVGEVGDGDAQGVVAEVEADDGAGRAVEGHQHRRAAALRGGRGDAVGRALDDHAPRPGGRRRGSTPSSELRPVWRAMSARLIAPRVRSASMTRRRLRSRRDSSDPVRSWTHCARPSPIGEGFVKSTHEGGPFCRFSVQVSDEPPRRRRPPAPRRAPWRCRPDRSHVRRHRRP